MELFKMPIYEYECTSCHHHFDLMQKISEEPIKQCPECAQHTVIKLISAAGFQLKGTGWYATDFKNKPSDISTKREGSNKTTNKEQEKPLSKTTQDGEKK